jgi:DNA-binding NtrC family response regulator
MPGLLLIDPNPIPLLDQIGQVLSPATVQVDVAATPQQALKRFQSNPPDAVLLDLAMPDISGLGVFHKLRQADARVPVIFITAPSAISAAIDAMRHGAFDYLLKPVDLQQLQRLVSEALEAGRRMRRPAYFGAPSSPADGDPIIGCCPAMLEV